MYVSLSMINMSTTLKAAMKKICLCHSNVFQVSPTKPKIVLSPKPDLPTSNGVVPPMVQNSFASRLELDGDGSNSPTLDVSNLTETEIRALKKHQRMIKNR